MKDPEAPRVIRSLAAIKPQFFLSEVRSLLPREPSSETICLNISLHLPILGLVANKNREQL